MPPLSDTRGVEGSHRRTSVLPSVDAGRLLWQVLLVAVVADLATTAYGLSVGLTEGNPVVAGFLGTAGLVGFVGLKLGLLAVGVVCWRLLPRSLALAVPAGLAVPTALAAAANAVTLLTV